MHCYIACSCSECDDLTHTRVCFVCDVPVLLISVVLTSNGYWKAAAKDEAVKAAGVTLEESKTAVHKYKTEELPNFLRLVSTH